MCLSQTVQSEQPLALEGGAAVNLSQSVLEQSRLVNNTAHGQSVSPAPLYLCATHILPMTSFPVALWDV